jgi:hypothetical protein
MKWASDPRVLTCTLTCTLIFTLIFTLWIALQQIYY